MNSAKFNTASIAAFVAALAAMPLAAGTVAAADLPITKAPPKISDAGGSFWAEIDYLGWTVKGDRLPPMVTASPAGTPLAQAGVLGASGTTVLFGDSAVNGGWRSGGRLQAGYWFDPRHGRGIEVSFFDLQDASTRFATDSNAHPILARPFFNALTNLQEAALVGFPGIVAGTIAVNESSRLLGAGALYRQEIGMWSGQRVSALIGYRYLHSSDKLSVPAVLDFGFGTHQRHRCVQCHQQFSRRRSRPCRRMEARPVDAGMARQGGARRQFQQRIHQRHNDRHRRRGRHHVAGRIAGARQQYR